jgi:hypothetical protein
MTEYLFPRPRDPPILSSAQFGEFSDLVRNQFDLPVQSDPIREKVRQRVLNHAEGMLLGPVMVALRWEADRGNIDLSKPLSLTELPGPHERLLEAFKALAHKGWVRLDGDQAEFTPEGRVALSFAWSYGVPVSYLPTFDPETLQKLLFGTPESIERLFALRDPDGNEVLVNRPMNVRASGAAHENYFRDLEEPRNASFYRDRRR